MTKSILTHKTCAKCKHSVPTTLYSKSSRNTDGLYSYCKPCDNARRKALANVNKESDSRKRREKRAANPEIFRERSRKSRQKWERENPERAREIRNASLRRTYEKNKEKRYARIKKWRQENKEKVNELNRLDYYKRRDADGVYTIEQWQELCSLFGNKCVCCGEQRKLTIDHIIPVTLGGSNSISNLQPLCKPCNSRKNNKVIVDYRLKWKLCRVDGQWFEKEIVN